MRSRRSPARRYLPPGWPLLLVFLAFPLWWALGLGAFIWPIAAVPMLLWLLRRPDVRAPRGFILWLGFVVWMLGSAMRLDTFDRWVGFIYRAIIYVSATIFLLYVFNLPEESLPKRRLARTLAVFWMYVVAFGVAAIVFPDVGFQSLTERLIPKSMLSNEFVYGLVHPGLAQIQTFLGFPVPRPAAPFVYTNDWGGNFGLLVPFVILAWSLASSAKWRLLTAGFAVAAIIPVVISLDRALWLSLAVGLTYAAVRLALAGRERALVVILTVLISAGTVVFLTPLWGLINDRLSHPHSNERRTSLYIEATTDVLASPLLGYGAPRPSERNPNAPSVGTQGQLWLVMFSHGFVGLGFFLAWFLFAFWRTRGVRTDVAFWCHVMLLIALIQLPFYEMLPTQLHIMMIAIALASRELGATRPPAGMEEPVMARPSSRLP